MMVRTAPIPTPRLAVVVVNRADADATENMDGIEDAIKPVAGYSKATTDSTGLIQWYSYGRF